MRRKAALNGKSLGMYTRYICAIVALVALVALGAAVAYAQTTSPTDGSTPLGLAPGSPAGSYALSGFDNINLYSGNLGYRQPLMQIGGRGSAHYTMMLPIEQHWRVLSSQVDFSPYYLLQPDQYWWSSFLPGYSPGVLHGRSAIEGYQPCGAGPGRYYLTLTRLTFTGADGTEVELRDQSTNGEPLQNPCSQYGEHSRGTVFTTSDGSAATFIADTPIYDNSELSGLINDVSGYLLFRDGTRYRIDGGAVTWIEDRNGNRITFTYDSYHRVTTIKDALNRLITITYADMSTVFYDEIDFKGAGGAQRAIRVWYASLHSVLRADYPSTKTYTDLFPELNAASGDIYDDPKVSRVELPDVDRPGGPLSYRYYYNPWGELARVELPTGGAFEYDYTPGSGALTPINSADNAIYRRVIKRRVYSDGVTLESESDYTDSYDHALDGTCGEGSDCHTFVQVDHRGTGNSLLASEKHYFYGDPRYSFSQQPLDYSRWKEGREYQTDQYNIANGVVGAVLRTATQTWQQRAPVSWWGTYAGETSSTDAPPNDPREVETTTTLVDSNQVAKRSSIDPNSGNIGFDQYNNPTDVWEYDYGTGGAGALLRHTHTSCLTVNAVNGIDYTAVGTGSGPHLLSLPASQSIFDAGGVERARTTYEYDNYGSAANHAPLVPRPGISGMDAAYTAGYQSRGNPSAATRFLFDNGTVTGSISTYAQYDIAGNVVQAIDALGNQTNLDYTDRFGSAAGEARSNTAPAELSAVGQTSYGFATLVTNAKGHTAYTKFDYYLGRPVDAEDANGVVSSGYYNDSLDRPTIIRAAYNTDIKTQTIFSYDDTNHTITRTSDLNGFGDNSLKSQTIYDGLGRTTETRSYETSTAYISTKQSYDGLGRVSQTSNPFRPGYTTFWTTTAYDALGRVISVTVPDNAVVTTAYYGNQTTLTDQAGKARKSISDGLGRLTQVTEDPNGVAYQTNYSYDALDDLIGVAQGSQTRTFVYDSLKRLTSATNPESGTTSYQYDNNGNLLRKTDARGVVTSFDPYDALNRVTVRHYSDGTPAVTYSYDTATNGKGRLASLSSSVSTTTYGGYDAMGRVTSSTQTTDGISYAMSYGYNLAGGMTSETYPSGRIVTTGFDAAGRISSLSGHASGGANKTYVSGITYAAHGAISSMALGNGLWEHTHFNNRLQATGIGLGTSPADSSTLWLGYNFGTTNNNGNLQTQMISAGGWSATQTYQYDGLNRLQVAQENSGSSWKQTFTYDRYGNRNFDAANTTPAMLSFNAAIDPATNQIAAGQGYVYDPSGNLTQGVQGGQTFYYAYDAESHQTSVTGANAANYYYDGDGRRVKKATGGQTTVFVYDTIGRMVAEYSDPASQTTNVTSYLTADTLGTPRVITNGGGAVLARHDYLPFGEEISQGVGARTAQQGYIQDTVRQQFTGQERDNETGLDYFESRYYSSTQGRFTGADSIMSNPKDPQAMNLYSYVKNNPLNLSDPTGHSPDDLDDSQDEKAKADAGFINTPQTADVIRIQTGMMGTLAQRAFDAFAATISDTATGAGKETYNMVFGTANLINAPINAGLTLFTDFQFQTYELYQPSTPGEGGAMLATGIVGAIANPEELAAEGANLGARASELHSLIDDYAQTKRTTAVLEAVDQSGSTTTIVASSQPRLEAVQRAALKPGELEAVGPGHAETTAIKAAQAMGLQPTRVGASRPICPECAKIIKELNIEAVSPFRKP